MKNVGNKILDKLITLVIYFIPQNMKEVNKESVFHFLGISSIGSASHEVFSFSTERFSFMNGVSFLFKCDTATTSK